jgi:hypothetical protein
MLLSDIPCRSPDALLFGAISKYIGIIASLAQHAHDDDGVLSNVRCSSNFFEAICVVRTLMRGTKI